jgi:rhamnosyltransferase
MDKGLISIIIRTYNEERYLDELLCAINAQVCEQYNTEIIIVDSGSTDKTIEIANHNRVKITYLDKKNFSFGRSLNMGCDFSTGDLLVFISGHCVPTNNKWLENLISPLSKGFCDYTYGRQLGRDTTKFSEQQIFKRYFPDKSMIPQKDFFCNNANAAITRKAWSKYRFNEFLTGLEDMYIAKQIYNDKGCIGYVSESIVYHIHDETFEQIKIRYERESIALQEIMPEVHISFLDMINFIMIGILKDLKKAIKKGVFKQEFLSIINFRFFQYYGVYRGNHLAQQLSYQKKIKYFYP